MIRVPVPIITHLVRSFQQRHCIHCDFHDQHLVRLARIMPFSGRPIAEILLQLLLDLLQRGGILEALQRYDRERS